MHMLYGTVLNYLITYDFCSTGLRLHFNFEVLLQAREVLKLFTITVARIFKWKVLGVLNMLVLPLSSDKWVI